MVNGKQRAKAKGKPKKKDLTPRQRLFIEEYLICWNASEAARRAGYKTRSNTAGAQILSNNVIRAAIDARLAEKRMSADEVLARLTAHAQGSLAPFLQMQGENAWIDLTTPEATANLHLIKEVETERKRYGKEDNPVEEFKVRLKIHDPQSALVQLGRYHKLFVDRTRAETWEDDLAELVQQGKASLEDVTGEFGKEIAARIAARVGISPGES